MPPIPSDSDHSHAIETAGTGGVRLTVSVPLGVARAGVIVLHEVWGLTAPVTALVVRLANCGYITAAPHLYHRIADPVVTDGKFTQARRYHDSQRGPSFPLAVSLWPEVQMRIGELAGRLGVNPKTTSSGGPKSP